MSTPLVPVGTPIAELSGLPLTEFLKRSHYLDKYISTHSYSTHGNFGDGQLIRRGGQKFSERNHCNFGDS